MSVPEQTVALVAGASRGIGLEITRQLLDRSGTRRVYASYRQASTAAGLLAIDDPRLITAAADVTNEPSLDALAECIRGKADAPNLVINATGILHGPGLQPEKSLHQCRPETLQLSFAVNSIGPLMLARAILPLMPRRSASHFAVLSAMVASIGDNRLGGWYGYRASKAALNQLMRTLAVECRRTHPRLCITAIHPGTTDTGLSRPFQGGIKPGKLYSPQQSAERILRVVTSGTPEDSGRFMNWDGRPIPW